VALGNGFVARLSIKTDLDFFLSGRLLPAWITGLAFIAANLGALTTAISPGTSARSMPTRTTGCGGAHRGCSAESRSP
jgi:Na+/proline symporter